MKIISKRWVYQLSVRDVELIFEAKDYSCFRKPLRKLKIEQFYAEYNENFNSKEIQSTFNRNVNQLRLTTKILELRWMFVTLSTGNSAKNANGRFKELFGKEFENDFDLINNKVKFFMDKIQALPKTNTNGAITFSELVAIIETSRNIPIDREMRLFEFRNIYNIELDKWQQTSNK